jgi:hypothetical protein
MAKFPIVGSEVQDLGELARSLRMARVVVNAALPLQGLEQEAGDGPDWLADLRYKDQLNLRAIAFRAVLRELDQFEYTARPSDLEALIEGRVPEPGGD